MEQKVEQQDGSEEEEVWPIISTAEVASTAVNAEIKEEESAASSASQSRYADCGSEDTEGDQEDARSDESYRDSSDESDEGSDDGEVGWQNQGNNFEENHDLETDEWHNNDDHEMIHQYGNEIDDLQIHEEDQLIPAHIDNDDLLQPTNDGTGDDGNGSPVLAATSSTTAVTASEVVGGKKRLREATSSTRNTRAQTRSTKRAKLPNSTLHGTSEVAGTTAQPRVLRRSTRRTATKACEGTFEGTSRGIEAEEEANDEFMPVVEEDGPTVDDGDDDLDEDGNRSIVSERPQQGHKSFDERFKALMDFKEKFGHCDVPQRKSGGYESLGSWCNTLRASYKKIQKKETPNNKLRPENIRQLEDAGFKWILL